MEATLLVELLTEELPPKSLARLGSSFGEYLYDFLSDEAFLTGTEYRWFATPRRLAAMFPAVRAQQPDHDSIRKGPAVSAASKAIEGFARACGVSTEKLERVTDSKGEYFAARVHVKGESLDARLAEIVGRAAGSLPIPKLMRWGEGEAQFARPVHGLVMMHGAREVPGTVLGVAASSTTRGHRFMGAGSIALASADEYESRLAADGMVIAHFASRRAQIERQLAAEAKRQDATLGDCEGLLDEVTALVEHPSVYAGTFDPAFLEMPQECLILTMRQNQKYFPLFDAQQKLLPKFLIVSNTRVADPRHIVGGNERVVRPRLEDARFFYNQDRKARLEERVPHLAKVVYHNQLGSQLERVERVQLLAGRIARELKADAVLAERAAWLAKADLVTGMVGEFPELQGTMGRYYALHDGEPREVADAIDAHYRPRFAGDRLPQGAVACAVALADKLDALAGLFGVGQQPSGDKDPFGLRRAALGVIRILVEHQLALSLQDLVAAAFKGYGGKIRDTHTDLMEFVFERFSGYLKDLGFSALEVEAVLSLKPVQLSHAPRQLEAVKAFRALPEAESLAAANKRVANILKQAARKGESFRNASESALKEPAEVALFKALRAASGSAQELFERGDYTGYLKAFAVLKTPVDAFFDSVMVMVEQDALRRNRLALLADLREAMNRVADISKLAA